jgi:anti-sigma factor RsiW
MTIAPLNCQDLIELVTAYLDGALSPDDRARFEGHLTTCPHCTRYLEQMRTTITVAGRLTEETITSEAKEKLLTAFREWRRG